MARIPRIRMKSSEPRGEAAVKALPEAGHVRREVLKRRAEQLDAYAEEATKSMETYSIDPEKLKEEPEILKHLNMHSMLFEVTNPVKGRAYCWVRKNTNSIAEKRNEARKVGVRDAWKVVESGDTEARELITAEGTREIGDCLLMWISIENYILIQKRMQTMNAYRELGISQKLSDFMREFEGRVQVHTMNEEPQKYLQRNKIIGPERNQGFHGAVPLRTEA